MIIETGAEGLSFLFDRRDHIGVDVDIWREGACNHPVAEVEGLVAGCHREDEHGGLHALFTSADTPRFPPGTWIDMICGDAAVGWYAFV